MELNEGGSLTFLRTKSFIWIGFRLSVQNAAKYFIAHRLAVGTKAFWARRGRRRKLQSVPAKLKAFGILVRSTATFDIMVPHWNDQLLSMVRVWEMNILRNLFKFKYAEHEGRTSFNDS